MVAHAAVPAMPATGTAAANKSICEVVGIVGGPSAEGGCEVSDVLVSSAPEIAVGVAGQTIEDEIAGSFAQTVGETYQELSTFWVEVPSPALGECTDATCTTPTAVTGSGTGTNYQPTDTVEFVWDQTGWVIGVVLLLSIVASAVKLMWQQRAEAGRELLESLLRFVVVSSAGLGAVVLLTEFSDALASSIIGAAIDETADGFGANFLILSGVSVLTGGSLGVVAVIAFGLLAILTAAFQVIVLIFRGALLVLVVGFLPLAAAATNTAIGRNAWSKAAGWILAFIVYKPVAALIYGAGFTLLATPMFDGDGPLRLLTGLAMMVLATLALPALIKLCVPATAALGSAGGNAMGWLAAGGAGAAALATGSGPVGGTAGARAVMARSGAGGSSGASSSTGGGTSGGSSSGGGGGSGSASGSSGVAGGGRHRSNGGPGASGGQSTSANGAASAGARSGTAASGAAAGGSVAGGGPATAGAGVAVQGARATGKVTRSAVTEAVGDQTAGGEGAGPDGAGR